MAVVNITINGQKIQAQMGQTVYEAAATAGIDIPVLAITQRCRRRAPAASAWWRSRSSAISSRPAPSR